MEDETMQLQEKISTILKDLVKNMIVRGKDWPLGRKAMRTNAIDEIIEVVTEALQAKHTQELREAVEAERKRVLTKAYTLFESCLYGKAKVELAMPKNFEASMINITRFDRGIESLSPENQGDVG